MKTMKATRIAFAMLMVGLVAVGGSAVYAFHHGGVAECSGCHSMHDPLGGYLTVGSDPSSTCLTCHITSSATPSSYHVATADATMPPGTAPTQMTPGGDFGWLKKTYTWTAHGRGRSEQGYTHGHNIVADDFNYDVDGRSSNITAPGGTFPNANLGCESCHDPHGQYRRTSTGAICVPSTTVSCDPIMGSGSYDDSHAPVAGAAVGVYRLLGGNGYGPGFPGVPPAVAPGSYNRAEDTTQTRVAYGYANVPNESSSWSSWCGTCHTDMHANTGAAPFRHKVDSALGVGVSGLYDRYLKTGDMSGDNSKSYLSLVPFAYNGVNGNDYGFLAGKATNSTTPLDGPLSGDLVTCFSCHRAHATGWTNAMRWNGESELLTYNNAYPLSTDPDQESFARGRTQLEIEKAYYDRPASPTFANYQRSLCNKCHVKD